MRNSLANVLEESLPMLGTTAAFSMVAAVLIY